MIGFSRNGVRPSKGVGPWRLVLVGLLAFAWAGSGTAVAQTSAELAALTKKLDQIERQLRAVQRVAFPDGKMATDFAARQQGGSQPRAGGGTLLADIEVRLGRIDTQMRALTGSIEEMAHRQLQLENQFANFRGDLEFRFRELEGGGKTSQSGASGNRAALAATRPAAGLVETPSPADARALLERQSRNRATTTAPALPEGSAEDQYKFAFALLRKGDYGKAEAAFRAFVVGNGEHRLAGNAQYWLGETYYVRKDYPHAAEAFLAGFQNYGEGSKGADSLIKLGLTLSNMGQNEDACAAFYEIEVSYPGASEAIAKRADSEKARLGCE